MLIKSYIEHVSRKKKKLSRNLFYSSGWTIMSFLYYAEGLGQTDEFKFFITLNLTVYIISYTQYKNHIHENGVFSGERVHI